MSTKWALEAIKNQRLKVSRFNDLNDPFELFAAELTDKNRRREFRSWKKEMSEKYGLMCFSTRWSNPLLWSHYADKHKGVALEVEIPNDYVAEVSYHPERLMLDIEQKLSKNGLSESDVYSLLTSKFEHWRYEDEVRVFKGRSDCTIENEYWFSEFGESMQLTGVIHGPLCQLAEREISTVLPKGMKLNLTKARLAFQSFSVVQNQWPGISIVEGNA